TQPHVPPEPHNSANHRAGCELRSCQPTIASSYRKVPFLTCEPFHLLVPCGSWLAGVQGWQANASHHARPENLGGCEASCGRFRVLRGNSINSVGAPYQGRLRFFATAPAN